MFVDTSVIVAILTGESDADALANSLAAARHRYSSAVVRLEASVVLATRLDVSPLQAQELFDEFVAEAGVSVVPITDLIGRKAVECFEHYGKGRHPARLNIADCLSYACAKAYRAPLLFKGDDFSQTDANDGLA
jgi:ribonuclease VapC